MSARVIPFDRSRRRPTPDLHTYDWILVNTSAGKDSQTALRQVVLEADRQGYPRERIVAVHADLGRMEWAGVPQLARRQAEHYGLRFEIVARRTKQGSGDDILAYARRRGAWPSSTARWCTSDFKRTPCRRVITQLDRETRSTRGRAYHVRVLQVFGFRAEESPARAKRIPFERDRRSSTNSRTVDNWLPVHEWKLEEVWADIHASGVEHHWAYDIGMPRLSCCFCIFAPKSALMLAGRFNRELLDEYVETERAIGHTFRKGFAIGEVVEALHNNTAANDGSAVESWCCG